MHDDLTGAAFQAALDDEPPVRLTVAAVHRAGRRRRHARRALVATGTVAALGVVGAGAAAILPGGPAEGPGPGNPSAGTPVALVPSDCAMAYSPAVGRDGDASVIPEVVAAAQAALAETAVLAPGRAFAITETTQREEGHARGRIRFGIGLAGQAPPGPPSGDDASPEPALTPSTADLNLTLEPRVGATPAELADEAAATNEGRNCPAPERITFPDGARALVTAPFLAWSNRGRAVMQSLLYFSPSGLHVNARVTQDAVVVGLGPDPSPDDGTPSPEPRYADTAVMALSPDEVLDLVRVVAGDG
jgi:hypothetical protein